MTLNIGNFTVEIKAKGVTNDIKYNKEDLDLFLTELHLAVRDSAMFHSMQGNQITASDRLKEANQIYEALSGIES